jgi:DNA-binding MarR family transcriptional regulator/N-acetylglutamate synthase-like GNAT family acetyltransferase
MRQNRAVLTIFCPKQIKNLIFEVIPHFRSYLYLRVSARAYILKRYIHKNRLHFIFFRKYGSVADPIEDIDPNMEARIERIRQFGRMYMHRIGALAENIFGSPFSLAEVRVLNELTFKKSTTASVLCRDLRMDGGYISRILQGFERAGLISKERSKSDGRQRTIILTRKGRKVAQDVLNEARRNVLEMLEAVSEEDQIRLVEAMDTIDNILNGKEKTTAIKGKNWKLRAHRVGDMGMIVHSHATEFAKDYGWNEEFEALVAEKTAEFIRNYDSLRERCWIAEMEGKIVGSLCLVKVKEDIAELRLLFVASEARNLGIGKSMLGEAIRFARHAGYKKLTMWTESILGHAQDLFEDAGLKIVREVRHHRFGRDLVGQHWEMDI